MSSPCPNQRSRLGQAGLQNGADVLGLHGDKPPTGVVELSSLGAVRAIVFGFFDEAAGRLAELTLGIAGLDQFLQGIRTVEVGPRASSSVGQ